MGNEGFNNLPGKLGSEISEGEGVWLSWLNFGNGRIKLVSTSYIVNAL